MRRNENVIHLNNWLRARLCTIMIAMAACFGASPGWAAFCDAIEDATRYEQSLAAQLGDGTRAPDQAGIEAGLTRLYAVASTLEQRNRGGDVMARAVAIYSASVGASFARLPDIGPLRVAMQLRRDSHRAALAELGRAAQDHCGPDQVTTAAFGDGAATALGRPTNPGRGGRMFGGLSLPMRLFIGFNIVLFVGSLLIIADRYYRMQKHRRERHMCSVDCDIEGSALRFQCRMVDISAHGAKLRLPHGKTLPARLIVTLAGQRHAAQIIWQNAHFAGIRFRKPVPDAIIQSVTEGVRKRQGPFGRRATSPLRQPRNIPPRPDTTRRNTPHMQQSHDPP